MQRQRVARGDLEHRRRGAVDVSPHHVFGGRGDFMTARHRFAPLMVGGGQMAMCRVRSSRLEDSVRPVSPTLPRDITTYASARLLAKSRHFSTSSSDSLPFNEARASRLA